VNNAVDHQPGFRFAAKENLLSNRANTRPVADFIAPTISEIEMACE
jgi:hypothetical protein